MKNLRKLFEILGKWRYLYLASGILLILSTSIRLIEPRVLQVTIDKVIAYFASGGTLKLAPGDFASKFIYSVLPELRMDNLHIILIYLGGIFIVLSLLRSVFMFSSSSITASSTEKAMKALRDKLFGHLQRLPLSYHNKMSTGELIQRCTGDVETVQKFASMQVVESLRMFVLFTGAFIMMASINLTYAFIAIASFPIITFGSMYFFKKEGQIWTEHEKQQDKLTTMVQENLSGIRVVKAFAKENYEIRKFTEQNNEKRKWGLKLLRLHSTFWPSSDFIVYAQVAVSVFAGGYFALTKQITLGEYAAFYTYAMLVTWPMRRLAQLVSEMGMTSVAIHRIYSILREKEEDYSGDEPEAELKGEVEFKDVYFKYEEDEAGILNGVSFSVKAGEKIALLGPTGAGKSTIISLLMRFYEPDKGAIMLDGKNLNEYSKKYVRNKIGVVLQKPFLFSTTIKENIAYTNPDTHIDEIVDSAMTANIHDIIEEIFPKSYDTVVGEKGVTLSGGQKQRVTIARTLLKDPDILVLDDSTSSVDTETEYEIQKALRPLTKNKTTLIIAHRITSVQNCDRIIVLDKGKVIEQGTHEELILNNGFYKRIYDIQISIEDEINDELNDTNGKDLKNNKFLTKDKINV